MDLSTDQGTEAPEGGVYSIMIGDRIRATKRGEDRYMAENVLHTDDPNAEGNLSAEEYRRRWLERAAELGDSGLHAVPQEVLDSIGGDSGEDR